jgi:phospholipid/cholesterol/gamma-HCH transport system permease protein
MMPSIVEDFFGSIGRKTGSVRENLYLVSKLINDTYYWSIVHPFRGRRVRYGAVVSEIVKTGYNAVPIITFISLLVGIILALQAAYQLRMFGATIYVVDLVGISLTREIAPILTALIVAGRSGSAFAAEIGSMKSDEEVDALVTMGINPVKFLVVPKLFALVIILPALTLFADFIGIFGGFLLSVTELGIDPRIYFEKTFEALLIKDILTGLVKAFAFGVVITLVGAYQGFKVEGGAEEVGRRTTKSVVVSSFLVILFDFFFVTMFYLFS